VKFAFVAAEKATYPVRVLCQTLGVSRAGFYAWHTRPPAARRQADQRLGVEIQAIHAETRQRYGSPRVHAELRDRGHQVGRKRVARLMRQHGLCARRRRRFRVTTDSNHPWPVAPNVLARQFAVAAPDTAWVTDITYLWTREGWLYLAVILDLFSRAVVGWAMSAQITTQHLTLQALTMALGRRRPPHGLLHHSDRGSQYASADYQRALTAHGIVGSMSRRGNCWDNAVAESFFATLKVELAHDADWATRAEARGDVFTYLEGFYNGARRHSALGYLSPLVFERHWAAGATVAAPASWLTATGSPEKPSSVGALGSTLRRGAAISLSPQTALVASMTRLPGIIEPASTALVSTTARCSTTP
jgi:transposase InsO family protein